VKSQNYARAMSSINHPNIRRHFVSIIPAQLYPLVARLSKDWWQTLKTSLEYREFRRDLYRTSRIDLLRIWLQPKYNLSAGWLLGNNLNDNCVTKSAAEFLWSQGIPDSYVLGIVDCAGRYCTNVDMVDYIFTRPEVQQMSKRQWAQAWTNISFTQIPGRLQYLRRFPQFKEWDDDWNDNRGMGFLPQYFPHASSPFKTDNNNDPLPSDNNNNFSRN